jgi:hypothetical protein
MGDRKLSQFLRDLRSLAPDRAGSQWVNALRVGWH